MTLYYCAPCVLHDRANVRFADEKPTEPCEHHGTAKDDCKRVEWVTRSFFCLSCSSIGKNTIVYHPTHPGEDGIECPEAPGQHQTWLETDESRWVRSIANIVDAGNPRRRTA